ncbi:MAG: aminodeoxychorismate synthase component I [bacterium]
MLPGGFKQMNGLGARGEPFLFIIGFNDENPLIISPDKAELQDIHFHIHTKSNSFSSSIPDKPFYFRKFPVSFEVYHDAFQRVLGHIKTGNSYLVNLTFPTPLETNLTLSDIYFRSQARYKLLFKEKFVVFSPEKFVQIFNGTISSFPMKGTIDANLPGAEKTILSDPKELAEHYTIVDLIRNDLSMVAKQVRVEKFRYVEKIFTNYSSLLQVSSEITGILPLAYEANIGEIIYRMLPAGSVSGAPKKKTLEIIRESEIYDRGYYTGIMGLFDGKNLDSGVMIRFIEQTSGGFIFKSGGGITSFSNPDMEYKEMVDKVYVPFT